MQHARNNANPVQGRSTASGLANAWEAVKEVSTRSGVGFVVSQARVLDFPLVTVILVETFSVVNASAKNFFTDPFPVATEQREALLCPSREELERRTCRVFD